METPLRWMLHCKTVPDEKLVVDEHELSDKSRWQTLD
jgi:hypothetical protein